MTDLAPLSFSSIAFSSKKLSIYVKIGKRKTKESVMSELFKQLMEQIEMPLEMRQSSAFSSADIRSYLSDQDTVVRAWR